MKKKILLAVMMTVAFNITCFAQAVEGLPTIKFYFVATNASPDDVTLVQNRINSLVAKKVGANVELHPLSFSEITTKIPLMLKTGDDADIVTVSQFDPYISLYQTGGLLALDSLLPKVAGNLYKLYEPFVWNAAKIKGRIYAVPSYSPGVSYPGIWTSKERMDKYKFDWTKARKWEDYEPYFDAILANEPGVTPILSTDEYWGRIWFPNYYGFEGVGGIKSPKGQDLVAIDAVKGKKEVFAAPFTKEYEANISLMRQWFIKGYVKKNPPTEMEMNNLRSTGKMAAFLIPFVGEWDTTGMGQAEWGGATIPQARLAGRPTIRNISVQTGLAISKASKNPELALKFIQESFTNADVQNLLCWGIEGVHWQWKDKAKKIITFVEGKTVDNTGYYPNASDQFRTTINKLCYYRSEGELLTDQRVADSIKNNSVVSPIFGFVPDMAPVKTAMANVANVAAQYGDPLEKGLVDPQDPKIGLAVFRAKLKSAGIDIIVAELQKQIDAWSAENKK